MTLPLKGTSLALCSPFYTPLPFLLPGKVSLAPQHSCSGPLPFLPTRLPST